MKQQRISGKEAARVAEDMAKPGPIRVVAASEAQEAPGARADGPVSDLAQLSSRVTSGHLALKMKCDWGSKFWRSAAQCFFGGMGLVLVTFVCFQLGFNAATAGFAYLILIVLLSLMGSFIGSVILSIVAVGCLSYFFAPPIFSFRVEKLADVLAIAAFLTTSFLVNSLIAQRKRTEDALRQSEMYSTKAQTVSRTGSFG
jgi:K+-sensing histidine kinase KdpD